MPQKNHRTADSFGTQQVYNLKIANNPDIVEIALANGTLNQAYFTILIDSTSFFTGWTGACTATNGNCTVSMTSDKTVTATFTAADRARIGTTGYSTLNAAYNAAASGTTIKALDAVLLENLTVTKALTIISCYNTTYSARTGDPTVLDGNLIVRNGMLIVDGLAVR